VAKERTASRGYPGGQIAFKATLRPRWKFGSRWSFYETIPWRDELGIDTGMEDPPRTREGKEIKRIYNRLCDAVILRNVSLSFFNSFAAIYIARVINYRVVCCLSSIRDPLWISVLP